MLIAGQNLPLLKTSKSASLRRLKQHRKPCPAEPSIAFLTDYAVVDRIIDHLKLTFVADKPPPPQIAYQEHLMTAEPRLSIFSDSFFAREEKSG